MYKFRKAVLGQLMVACSLLVFYHAASASTALGSLSISATVVAACSVTGSPLAFGNYSASQVDQTTTLSVLCTSGTTYTIALDAGIGASATTSIRKMTGPASATLNYTLARDAGHSNNWGNATGTDTAAGTGNGLSQSINVYGRIAAGQLSGTGSYTDTVTVTLTY